YQASIPESYQEKLKEKYIYFEKFSSDESLKKQLLSEGIHTIETDDYIDPHFMQHSEMHKLGETNYKFASVDSEIENLLSEGAAAPDDMKIKEFFQQILIGEDKEKDANLEIDVKSLKNSSSTAYFKVDENMKRFQQMTRTMGQNNFPMPIKKTLVVNPKNALIQNAMKIWDKGEKKELAEKIAHHVQDLATLSGQGLDAKEKESFVDRSQQLIQELSNYVL